MSLILPPRFPQIDERYASIDDWLEKEYQLTPQAREALQARLLEG